MIKLNENPYIILLFMLNLYYLLNQLKCYTEAYNIYKSFSNFL